MTYADRIPLTRPVPTTRHRLDDARSHALEVERDDLRIQVGREQADNRAMMRDRDQALAERDQARAELGAAQELIAVAKTWREWYGEPRPPFPSAQNSLAAAIDAGLGSPPPRAQDEPDSDARRLLDQAIDAALPLAGGRVAELLDALRCELARVDAKRAEREG